MSKCANSKNVRSKRRQLSGGTSAETEEPAKPEEPAASSKQAALTKANLDIAFRAYTASAQRRTKDSDDAHGIYRGMPKVDLRKWSDWSDGCGDAD